METLQDLIYKSYAYLAALEANLKKGNTKIVYRIMQSQINRFKSGNLGNLENFKDDEINLRMDGSDFCWYCGRSTMEVGKLQNEHVLPKCKSQIDEPCNLVPVCKECNGTSEKGTRDLIEWMKSKDYLLHFYLMRRYVKLVHLYAKQHGLLELPEEEVRGKLELPFRSESLKTIIETVKSTEKNRNLYEEMYARYHHLLKEELE